MKSYSSGALEALNDGTAIVSGAVFIDLDPPFRVWGGYGTIEIGGETFVGLGTHGLVSEISGALGGAETPLDLELSGVDPDVLAAVDASGIRDAAAVVWELIFDGSGSTLLAANVARRGRIDRLVRDDVVGGPAVLRATIEGAARGLGRHSARMRTDADQRAYAPDDSSMSRVGYAHEKQLYLGGERPHPIRYGTGGSCPAPEMPILLVNGATIEAGSLRPGDRVRTRHEITGADGGFEVHGVQRVEGAWRWAVWFEDGRRFIGSPSHLFAVGDGPPLVWRRLEQLQSGDLVLGLPPARVVAVEPFDEGPVIQIGVTEAHTYVVCGLQSHNKLKRT